MKSKKIIFAASILFLGGFMIYGSIGKFVAPKTEAYTLVERVSALAADSKTESLQKSLYIGGAKQTGYFWELLGVCELLFGILLLVPVTRIIAALGLLPITLHIFLFHLYLEPDELSELILTGGLLASNILILVYYKDRLKALILKPPYDIKRWLQRS